MTPILPGATIGILGGGQLGRMTALAARRLGYAIHVLDPDPECPARSVADRCLTAPFDDPDAAADLARYCDVVTIEIEQVATMCLEAAARYAPVRPGAAVLHVVQDRSRQKSWLADRGFPLGPYRDVLDEAGLREAFRSLGPCFVKACHGGYDGRSQARVETADDLAGAATALGGRAAIVEEALDLDRELSVLVARTPSGATATYSPAVNHHEQQVLAWSVLPGALPPAVADQALSIARAIAEAIDVEGLLAVEMFLLRDGRLLVNELAPRPHNSFHETEQACATSQFEQLVRAICDLPLGDSAVIRPAAIVNLFGDLWLHGVAPPFDAALAVPGAGLHLYGKRVPRPRRKMGHVSATGKSALDALSLAQEAASRLTPRVGA